MESLRRVDRRVFLILLIFVFSVLSTNLSLANAGFGKPKIDVGVTVTPSSVKRGGSCSLEVTIKNSGDDWAKDVNVTITLSKGTFQENGKNAMIILYSRIDETEATKKLTYIINVPLSSSLGSSSINVNVEYWETLGLDTGLAGPYTSTDSTTFNVLNCQPSADFTYSPSSPSIQDTITLTDKSRDDDGTIKSWLWNFGDETTSTSQNPTHKYIDKGKKTITLTVTDSDGTTNSIDKTLAVMNMAPTASFNYSPQNPEPQKSVTFVDASTDPEGKTLTCVWNFGDGQTSTEKNPNHIYEKSGEYVVKLTVTDDEGLTHTVSKTLSISVPILPSNVGGVPTTWILGGIVGAAVVVIVIAMMKIRRHPPSKRNIFVKCPYCRATIPIDSEKCPICGADLKK